MGRRGRWLAGILLLLGVGGALFLTRPPGWACALGAPCPSVVPEEPPTGAPILPTATPASALRRLGDLIPDEMKPSAVIASLTEERWRLGPMPRYEAMVRSYGSQGFVGQGAMPDELRRFYVLTSEQIGTTFGVPAEAILAFMQARDPDGRLWLVAPEARSAQGISGLTAEEWNGWAVPPEGSPYVLDLAAIEQQGGIGFDWSYRYMLTAWQEGTPSSTMDGARADPTRFENAIAAVARLLAREGITTALAEQEPTRYGARLADLIAAAPPAPDPALAPLRTELAERLDRAFGIRPDEARLAPLADGSPIAAQVTSGALPLANGADQLFNQFVSEAIAAGEAADREGRPRSWPFIATLDDFEVQRAAVTLVGHTLTPWELEAMQGSTARVATVLSRSRDARLLSETRDVIEATLQRTARGLPIPNSELTTYRRAALAESPGAGFSARGSDMALFRARVEYHLRLTEEYRQLYGDRVFVATPLQPMPTRIIKPFGSPASYQPEGIHTGLDLRGQRDGAKEPTLYAMDAGTVVHVGPLYCNQEKKCRGAHAVVIDHGNNVYTLYSHNSEAFVRAGDVVEAGQAIGRQGNEGYSRGPHLHLEVHIGARWSGDWTRPFSGGGFVDPLPWIPFETTARR